jgi:hypothetical protein
MDKDIAKGIEVIVSAAIALSTFLSNSVLTALNCFIAATVFPFSEAGLILVIAQVVILILVIHACYVWAQYDVLDLGEISIPILEGITYDNLLRLEQVVLNILIAIYFGVGIYLNPILWRT